MTIFCSHQKLLFHNIPLERVSEDKGKCNSHGSKLLSMCKNNNVFICNGRAGDDKGVGRVTSNQTSLIDYLILSPDLFPFVPKFGSLTLTHLFPTYIVDCT